MSVRTAGMLRKFTALLVALAACRGASEPLDASRCAQTYEFGNSGCADLAGVVTDRVGRPLARATVSARPADSARGVDLGASFVQTDTAGRYQLRVTRMLGAPPSSGPDTLTVTVYAAVPPPAGTPVGAAGPYDRVPAVVEFARVGETPKIGAVSTLAVPAP